MRTSDGSIRTFDVPVDKFHELRHSVAKALRGMQGLEVHPVARIMGAVDQADRQAIRREENAGGAGGAKGARQ
jgi:hypothetical protein